MGRACFGLFATFAADGALPACDLCQNLTQKPGNMPDEIGKSADQCCQAVQPVLAFIDADPMSIPHRFTRFRIIASMAAELPMATVPAQDHYHIGVRTHTADDGAPHDFILNLSGRGLQKPFSPVQAPPSGAHGHPLLSGVLFSNTTTGSSIRWKTPSPRHLSSRQRKPRMRRLRLPRALFRRPTHLSVPANTLLRPTARPPASA